MNRKNIIVLIIVTILLIIACVFMFKDRKKDMKNFDFIKIEEQMKRSYEEEGLNTLDFMDVASLFGIDTNEIPDSVFLGNINAEEMTKENMMLIVAINTKKVDLTQKLFDEYAPKYADRNGGYTRIVKIAQRKGDGALEVLLELV